MIRITAFIILLISFTSGIQAQIFKNGELFGLADFELGQIINSKEELKSLEFYGETDGLIAFSYSGECCKTIFDTSVWRITIYYESINETTVYPLKLSFIQIFFENSINGVFGKEMRGKVVLTDREIARHRRDFESIRNAFISMSRDAGLYNSAEPFEEEDLYQWSFNQGEVFLLPNYRGKSEGFTPELRIYEKKYFSGLK